MNIQYFLVRTPAASLIFSLILGMASPAAALAASKATASPNGTIDQSSLSVASGKKMSLSGTASSTTKVRYEITAENSSKSVAKSKNLKVRKDGSWSGSVSKKVKDGTYDVTLYAYSGSKKKEVASATLVVGAPPATLSVSSIALLSGGTARANETVPISYLQVRNVGSSTVAIKGFWVAQNGSAPTGSVSGFSSIDDKGGSQGSVSGNALFKAGKAYIPSTATVAPGERKLFTLKAQLSSAAGSFAGTSLMLDVTGIDAASQFKASFPIRGTTWTVVR